MPKPYPKERDKKPVVVRHVKRLKPHAMSGHKQRELLARAKLREQLRQERGDWCEAKLQVCTGRWSDMHELLARSQGGDCLDSSNILCVCRKCHIWITDHPSEAMRLGLRRSRQVQQAGLYC